MRVGEEIRSYQAGQILLIVILVVIVASTVGLSLISRSITSIRTATEEAESQKALAAAEAGIERALQGNVDIAEFTIPSNKSKYSVDVTAVENVDSFLLNGGNIIPKNEGADIWLVGHDATTGAPDYSSGVSPQFFHLYWGSESETECSSAAIQAIVVTRDPSLPNEIKSFRYTYDSCSSRSDENNFKEADSGGGLISSGLTFGNRTPEQGGNSDLNQESNIVFMRIIPLYKDTIIGVDTRNHGGNNETPLPSQGYVISSTGISGAANRKLNVFKGYPQTYLPYISYGLFVAED